MELSQLFRSVIDQDRAPVVLCDTNHTILYMNPAAVCRYAKRGGEALVGQSLLTCHSPRSQELIREAAAWFLESREHNTVYEFHNEKENRDVYMVALRDTDGTLIGYYEKHEYRTPETARPYGFRGDGRLPSPQV